jgi:glycosyltransferase involved in cell wall biosynthesis
MSDTPLVSVCMPAYNAAQWLRETIESVLAQTYPNFELVISDNASTDSTVEIARSYSDPRIRVFESDRNVGHVANHSRVIELSRGEFVKFLHADDLLAPNCLEEMVAVAREDESIGLVFSSRLLELYDSEGKEWLRMKTRHHERFRGLERSNDGRVLFFQIVLAGIDDNWLGEPSAVMIKRRAFEECGLFNRRVRESVDLELYLRIMLRYRVGFVDDTLCVHREHFESVTAADRPLNRNWLDRLWLLEGLLADGALGPTRDMVYYMRRAALRRALRGQVRRLAKRQFTGELLTYLRYRRRTARGEDIPLHDQLAALAND